MKSGKLETVQIISFICTVAAKAGLCAYPDDPDHEEMLIEKAGFTHEQWVVSSFMLAINCVCSMCTSSEPRSRRRSSQCPVFASPLLDHCYHLSQTMTTVPITRDSEVSPVNEPDLLFIQVKQNLSSWRGDRVEGK
jgi:hypothetical protein